MLLFPGLFYIFQVPNHVNFYQRENRVRLYFIGVPTGKKDNTIMYADVGADNEVLTWKPLLNMGEQEESNSILSKVVVAFQQVSHTLNE